MAYEKKNIFHRVWFYFFPMPLFGKCIICGGKMKKGELESCFHPVTNEWMDLKRIHWDCYVKVHDWNIEEREFTMTFDVLDEGRKQDEKATLV